KEALELTEHNVVAAARDAPVEAHRLEASATDQIIRAVPSYEYISPAPSRQDIPAFVALQVIVAGTALQRVVAQAAIKLIVAVGRDQHVAPASTVEIVVAVAVVEIVVEVVAVQDPAREELAKGTSGRRVHTSLAAVVLDVVDSIRIEDRGGVYARTGHRRQSVDDGIARELDAEKTSSPDLEPAYLNAAGRVAIARDAQRSGGTGRRSACDELVGKDPVGVLVVASRLQCLQTGERAPDVRRCAVENLSHAVVVHDHVGGLFTQILVGIVPDATVERVLAQISLEIIVPCATYQRVRAGTTVEVIRVVPPSQRVRRIRTEFNDSRVRASEIRDAPGKEHEKVRRATVNALYQVLVEDLIAHLVRTKIVSVFDIGRSQERQHRRTIGQVLSSQASWRAPDRLK